MSRIEQIERQVQGLNPKELRLFREWFATFDAELWDTRLENDIKAGKLDRLTEQALHDHSAGRSTKV